MTTQQQSPELPERLLESWKKFSSDSSGMVSVLANGFNRKKQLFAMQNSNRKSVGKIDMHALWKYKTHEDVFLKKTFTPKGKSHSCFVLMDWSGSMQGQIFPMVKQAIIFAEFCRKVKIPYRIYAFTSSDVIGYGNSNAEGREQYIDKREIETEALKHVPDGCAENGHELSWGNLVEFMSDKMSEKEFQIAKRRLFALGYSIDHGGYNYYSYVSPNPEFSLGGTPLNQALLAIRPVMRKHSRDKGIQNPNLIVLSDGQSGQLHARSNDDKIAWSRKKIYVDKKNNKTYTTNNENGYRSYYEETEILYRMIKSDGVRLIGYYLCRGNKEIESGVQYIERSTEHFSWKPHTGSVKDGYAVSSNYGGCDSFYVINTKKVFKESGYDLFDEENSEQVDVLTNRQIKTQFKKSTNTSKNRKFLASSLVDDLVANL